MKSWLLLVAVVATLGSACGSSDASSADPSGTATIPVSPGAADIATRLVGRYGGTMTLTHGPYTYTMPVAVDVTSPAPDVVRVPVREMCPSVDHVDFTPPEALLVALAEPGTWSFALPTGEKVRLSSIHARFDPDGDVLVITFAGVVGDRDLAWTFEGRR